jgi:hypothetical protein
VKALLLDCDGVIGSGTVWRQNETKRWTCVAGWLEPQLIARLNRVVRRTEAKVVLSTSWRKYLGWRTVAGVLYACGFTGTVIGATEVLGEGITERRLEILEWVQAHPEVTAWAAVDDCEIEGLGDRFVRTHAVHGLTDVDVEKLVAILKRS